MSFAVRSTIDVALWFHDKADATRTRLPAQTLQRLLLLAQARYRPVGLEIALMPAVFVPSSLGPVEPNVFALFEAGVPTVTRLPLAERVMAHLQSIWQAFGALDPDALAQAVNADLACMRLVAANDSPVPKPQTKEAPDMAPQRKDPKPSKPTVIKGKGSKSGQGGDTIGSALGDLVESLQTQQAAKPKSAAKTPKTVRKWQPKRRVQ
jgi:hypothetical protein